MSFRRSAAARRRRRRAPLRLQGGSTSARSRRASTSRCSIRRRAGSPSRTTSRSPRSRTLAVSAGCGAALPDAKSQFLCSLKASGGFPNDQEVSISLGFLRESVDGDGQVTSVPTPLDTTTIKVAGASGIAPPFNVAVMDVTNAPTTVTPVAVEASYDAASGTLTLRKPPVSGTDPTRRWEAGHRYAVLVRGGASGVKAAGGATIEPMPTMYVLREAILSDRDLTLPENQSLIPGTAEQKAASGASLEQIRLGYAAAAAGLGGRLRRGHLRRDDQHADLHDRALAGRRSSRSTARRARRRCRSTSSARPTAPRPAPSCRTRRSGRPAPGS